ncbi:MAG: PKD domain-containing protein [Solirubrobacterales bacterium]
MVASNANILKRVLPVSVTFALLVAPAADARKLFVAQAGNSSVSVIETTSNSLVGSSIVVGLEPVSIALTPDGARAYVANATGDSVSVIDASSQTVVATVPVGNNPDTVAISPTASRGYVSNFDSGTVSVIDTSSNAVVGSPIVVPAQPAGMALTPDGSRLYVGSDTPNTVSVIDTASNTVIGSPIPAGADPTRLTITPDGSKLFVSNVGASTVTVISTAAGTATKTIPIGGDPRGIAVAPDGQKAFVASLGGTVSAIDVASESLTSPTISSPTGSSRIAFTPDGARLYVSDSVGTDGRVTAFDASAASSQGFVTLQSNPEALAITPDQAPTASFTTKVAAAGATTRFDGSASSSPDGTVTRFDWNFGDGATLPDGGATPAHVYARKGKHTATLTVTDNEGTSTQVVFTGQSVLRNGKPTAADTGSFTTPNITVQTSARKNQSALRRRGVTVSVKCADVACTATATGSIGLSKQASAAVKRIKLKRARRALKKGKKRTLKLKLSSRSRRQLAGALRRSRKATARIRVVVRDAAGNRVAKTLRVRVKR